MPTKYDIATDKWGYLISSDMNPVRWFKLLLLKQDDKSYKKEILDSVHLKHARDILAANPPITPVEVVSRYLRKLWQHTCLQIQSRVGASVFDNFPLRVAITVPAIWPPYAQQAMRDAARLAGILDERDIGATTLDLVQEPEAAGLSTLVERQQIVSLEVRALGFKPHIFGFFFLIGTERGILHCLRCWRRYRGMLSDARIPVVDPRTPDMTNSHPCPGHYQLHGYVQRAPATR